MPPPRDITKDFVAAASALSVSEIVKDEFFTLAESVGALEIMDPKMDSGCLQPGETLEAGYDISQSLGTAQIIGLMDQLLCFEAAWQRGHSLAQTVFTSLYIDEMLWPVPRTLSDATFLKKDTTGKAGDLVEVALRAYCCGVIKACDLIQAQITSEQYYEEEDFSSHLYRRELLTRVPVSEVKDLLGAARASVRDMADIDCADRDAILVRLSLREKLLSALGSELPDAREDACSAWSECQKLIEAAEKSSTLGSSLSEAFSQKVQRKLASTTPPRPIVEVELGEAFGHFSQMSSQAQDAFCVLDCTTGMSVLNFLVTYMSQNPQPNVYVRCLTQTLIYKEGTFLGKKSNQDFILQDLSKLVIGDVPTTANSEVNADERDGAGSIMHSFAEIAAHAFADLTRCLCMNRSRTRRMLTHTLNDWENLQFEAEDIDVQLREQTGETPLIDRLGAGEEIWSYPLSSWVYIYKLKQMEWIIQLGFELDIYMPDECSALLWHLKYIATTRQQHLERVRTFVRRSLDLMKRPTPKQTALYQDTFDTIDYAILEAEATSSFAEALSSIYQAFRSARLLPETPRPYGNSNFRHNLRLKPFLTVSLPPVPSNDEVGDALGERIRELDIQTNDRSRFHASEGLLIHAEALLKMARRAWDAASKQPAEVTQCVGYETAWTSKVKDLLKSIISAGIVVAGTRKAIAKAGDGPIGDIRVVFPKAGYHEWWPVPSLKPT